MKQIITFFFILFIYGCTSQLESRYQTTSKIDTNISSSWQKEFSQVLNQPEYACGLKYGYEYNTAIPIMFKRSNYWNDRFICHELRMISDQSYKNKFANRNINNPVGANEISPCKFTRAQKKIINQVSKESELSLEFCTNLKNINEAKNKLWWENNDAENETRMRQAQVNEYIKLCKDLGFEEETESMSNCLLKQEELRVIREKEPTVVTNKKSRSSYQFCQSLPGAYTPTWHCW